MLKRDYFLICKLSSFFLNKNKFWYSKYYNFFHPIKFHPAHTRNYDTAYGNKKSETLFLKLFNYSKESFTELISFQNYKLKTKNYDTCIISHIISNENKYLLSKDLYFKGFYEKLKSPFVVYRNLTTINSECIKKKLLNDDTIVVNKKSFFIKELYYLFFALFIFINIKYHYLIEKNKTKKKFLKEASKFIYVGSSITNLRFYHQILKIIKLYDPKEIFITFEGNAWEKIIIYKLRKKFQNIMIYGYQFASLNKNHGILNIKLNKFFYPHKILTIGKINYNLLKQSKINKNIPIKIVGTAKYQNPIKIKKFVKTCLILPGENKLEVYKFFDLTKKLAYENKDFKFIFRLHPQRNIKYYFENKILIPKNMEISKKKFEEDLKNCFFAIYGGSTAIVNCLSKGLWPIYYDYNKINVDVIFKLKLKKRSIKNAKDFKILVSNKFYFHSNFYKVQKFYKDYYNPLKLTF